MGLYGRQDEIDAYNRIEISKKALLNNIDFFRRKTGLQIIPVVKSNAYGHGIAEVTQAIKSKKFPYIAVNSYFEALVVRKITKTPILIMGMIKPENFNKIKTDNIAFTVHDKATVDALGALDQKISIHLEIDSGMNRYGIAPDELSDYLLLIKSYPKLNLDGVMTHLADPDGKGEENIKRSTSMFDNSVKKVFDEGFKPKFLHIGQSASSVRVKSRYANATRIGLSLYGINPFVPSHKLYSEYKNGLKPVLKLVSTISKINRLKPGDKISYNYTFTANKPMKIAVLPLGYYEGIDWRLGNKGKVKFGKSFLPIVGKVCMNHTMVDLKDSDAKVGDEVTIFSDLMEDPNSINNLAQKHGLFVYDLPTSLPTDIRRVLV